ncbi:hypothetical protein FRC17_006446 [Serendipita sp. 399]|nr:hypothetical protein FRC17_006446 [Serendipita sp. 399]
MAASIYLLFLSFVTALVYGQSQGTITSPAPGAKIRPLQAFPFAYRVHQDYCTSSHNITVALTTQPPTSMGSNTGHYFGRFATGSYPAQGLPNPNPPVPSALVMPDFSKQPGGFGTGATACNLPVYINVIEEWNTCQV